MFDRNFGRSLLADFSDHYLSNFVLHGTSDTNFKERLIIDLHMATQVCMASVHLFCVYRNTQTYMLVSTFNNVHKYLYKTFTLLQHPVLDEPITEAVFIVADTDKW